MSVDPKLQYPGNTTPLATSTRLSSSGSHFLFFLNVSDYMKFDIKGLYSLDIKD